MFDIYKANWMNKLSRQYLFLKSAFQSKQSW